MGNNQEKVRALVDSNKFQIVITAIIVFNALVIGLRTMSLDPHFMVGVIIVDYVCVAVYVVELALRIYAYRGAFFKDAWNVFDFVIVIASLVPASLIPVPANVLRTVRVIRTLRILRIVSSISQLRIIVQATLKAIPGVMWAGLLMFIIMYIYGIIGTICFGPELPQYFGELGRSLYTLFECMTLEGWNGVAEDTMAVSNWGWLYFLTYIVISALILMNVVVGIVVESVQHCQEELSSVDDSFFGDSKPQEPDPDEELDRKMAELQRQMAEVSKLLAERNDRRHTE